MAPTAEPNRRSFVFISLVTARVIQSPSKAFLPEFHWEPNTRERVDNYFEELEEQGLVGDSEASAPCVLYDDSEALGITMDLSTAAPFFNPPVGAAEPRPVKA